MPKKRIGIEECKDMVLTKNEQDKSPMNLDNSKVKSMLTMLKSKKFLTVFLPLVFLLIPHIIRIRTISVL